MSFSEAILPRWREDPWHVDLDSTRDPSLALVNVLKTSKHLVEQASLLRMMTRTLLNGCRAQDFVAPKQREALGIDFTGWHLPILPTLDKVISWPSFWYGSEDSDEGREIYMLRIEDTSSKLDRGVQQPPLVVENRFALVDDRKDPRNFSLAFDQVASAGELDDRPDHDRASLQPLIPEDLSVDLTSFTSYRAFEFYDYLFKCTLRVNELVD